MYIHTIILGLCIYQQSKYDLRGLPNIIQPKHITATAITAKTKQDWFALRCCFRHGTLKEHHDNVAISTYELRN